MYIEIADEFFVKITLDEIITDDEAKEMDAKIYPVLKYVNELIDIQTKIGARETKEMISLLDKFSSFIIGAIALAITLLGSIVYDMFKKPALPKKPLRKVAVKKVAVRKVAVKQK
jgi:hypothetical protein